MIGTFADKLEKAPLLRAFHPARDLVVNGGSDLFGYLDVLEAKAQHSSVFRSLRHGNDEVLHARVFGQYVEFSPSHHSLATPIRKGITYIGSTGLQCWRKYERERNFPG